jgi:hypothetical protein
MTSRKWWRISALPWVLDPAQMGVVQWCANRIEELGKKGAGL